MFGYVTVNKPELKVKDFERYRAFYCGLCRALKKKYGRSGQITLTYDMTFLIMLLTSLYEKQPILKKRRCILHPLKRQSLLQNEITEYAADMNIALSYMKFQDDWKDEKKISGLWGSVVFHRKYNKIEKKYKRQCQMIQSKLQELEQCEKRGETEIDIICRPFGELMAEILIYKEDAFEPILRKLGFYLGKFIYLMDAKMDLIEDEKNGNFNPLLGKGKEVHFEEWINQMMTLMISEVAKEFEKLPLEWDVDILRNIIYEGVWQKSGGKK